jgi:pimeloyl-ACP methyl ester carboxylesterase
MNEAETCGLAAGAACAAPGPLNLQEVLARFGREAARGVCDTGRYRCPYYVWGEGPPLLFVPGLCDDALSFVLPAAALSGQFRCLAYDLPAGRGDGADLARYRHEDYVSDALALLDHVGARRSYVLGSSFGSTVALAALHREPARLARAVFVGGFAWRPLAAAEVLLARLARGWPGAMRRLPFRTALLRRAHFGPFAARPADCWEFYLSRCGAPPIAAVARRATLLHRTDLRSLLSSIRQPVLLVCGDGDPLVGKDCEEVLLRGLPNAVRAELECCGHLPQFTHPELLAEVVRRFLTPPSRPEGGERGA